MALPGCGSVQPCALHCEPLHIYCFHLQRLGFKMNIQELHRLSELKEDTAFSGIFSMHVRCLTTQSPVVWWLPWSPAGTCICIYSADSTGHFQAYSAQMHAAAFGNYSVHYQFCVLYHPITWFRILNEMYIKKHNQMKLKISLEKWKYYSKRVWKLLELQLPQLLCRAYAGLIGGTNYPPLGRYSL